MTAASPKRPALRWHGGKWKLAPWIMAHFPPHRVYVEPFGGGGSVLLRKRRSYAEIYNDLDDEVVTLFQVLRDRKQAARLKAHLELTPFARREFQQAYRPARDPVEQSRRLIIRSFMGFGSNAHASQAKGHRSTGFRATSNRSGTTPAHDWANYPEALEALVARLAGVVIEHRDAFDCMAAHDSPQTLHYLDPPYLPELRSPANKFDLKWRMYRHEMTEDDHVRLLMRMPSLAGMVLLSGYPSPLYDRLLPGWWRDETQTHADGARDRTECLWVNPACVAALDRARAPLFSVAE